MKRHRNIHWLFKLAAILLGLFLLILIGSFLPIFTQPSAPTIGPTAYFEPATTEAVEMQMPQLPTLPIAPTIEPIATENTVSEAYTTEPTEPTISEDSFFEIHYLDVGQADAAIVLCDDEAMMIDGGNSADSSFVYSYLNQHDINHLDYMVATHAHEDHIGGLSGALNFAKTDTAFCPVTYYDSKAFSSFVKYLGEQNEEIIVPKVGDTFALGSASVQVIGVNGAAEDTNDTSIVLRITYGETSFLFTGDAERAAEQTILASGLALQSTVLKVGHHGSNSSSSYVFIREVAPQYAVISVGEGNSYGHPSDDTLSRLRDAEVKTYRTDLQGTIICTSDGHTVSFAVERNEDADTLAERGAGAYSLYVPEDTPSTSSNSAPLPTEPASIGTDYIGNKNTMKFHYPSCGSVGQMKESNKFYFTGTRTEMIDMGYVPCKKCNP